MREEWRRGGAWGVVPTSRWGGGEGGAHQVGGVGGHIGRAHLQGSPDLLRHRRPHLPRQPAGRRGGGPPTARAFLPSPPGAQTTAEGGQWRAAGSGDTPDAYAAGLQLQPVLRGRGGGSFSVSDVRSRFLTPEKKLPSSALSSSPSFAPLPPGGRLQKKSQAAGTPKPCGVSSRAATMQRVL